MNACSFAIESREGDACVVVCASCGMRLRVPAETAGLVFAECQQQDVTRSVGLGGYASPPPAGRGPGTELSKLLKRFGIEPTPTCACRAKAAEMDAWGCDEAGRPERIDEVVAVMRAEAKARGLPFVDAVGRMLVRRAIANARRNA